MSIRTSRKGRLSKLAWSDSELPEPKKPKAAAVLPDTGADPGQKW
jgi:hypothetical protein